MIAAIAIRVRLSAPVSVTRDCADIGRSRETNPEARGRFAGKGAEKSEEK